MAEAQRRGDIHRFCFNGDYFVLDVNSGAVHAVDRLAYDLIGAWETGEEDLSAINQYSPESIREAAAEIEALVGAGLLFSPPLDVPAVAEHSPVVKALCLHVAHACNLACIYCFGGGGTFGSAGLMTPEVAKQAVDFLIAGSGSRGNCEIDFFGGEPLVNFSTVRQTVAYIRQRERESGKRFKLTLTTNAVLLDDAALQFLNAEDISLILSLDGRREVHDRARPFADGSGSYDACLAGIRRAICSRPGGDYYVRGTYTALNLDFANDVLAMADMGFDRLSVEPVVALDSPLAITEAHLPFLYAEYDRLAGEYLRRREAGRPFEFFHFNVELDRGPCLAKRISGCGAGHEYFAVAPDGSLWPCHQFVGREGFWLGNVYQGIVRPDILERFRATNALTKEACRSCWARFHCGGGCHANAHLMNGDIAKPYRIGCELQKKRLECALAVQAKMSLKRQGIGPAPSK